MAHHQPYAGSSCTSRLWDSSQADTAFVLIARLANRRKSADMSPKGSTSSLLRTRLQVAALVAVLKVARQLQLVRELDAVQVPGHAPVPIPEALLQRAIAHANEGLLVDAMTLACVHPKTTAMPGEGRLINHLLLHAFISVASHTPLKLRRACYR